MIQESESGIGVGRGLLERNGGGGGFQQLAESAVCMAYRAQSWRRDVACASPEARRLAVRLG